MLAITTYLKGNATAWFKPTIQEYLEKGYVSKYEELETFSYYNEFKRRFKEAFSNLV